MQHGHDISSYNATHLEGERFNRDCTFCQQASIQIYILKETPNFLLIVDHAPLVEGHLLIIPRQHFACYGAVPATLDEELLALKREVQQFFARYYVAPIFWEHGVFRQSVFHAHLHCFPFGTTAYELSANRHCRIVASQDDIRNWYETHGHYIYVQDREHALLFPPEMDTYNFVVQNVLRFGVTTHTRHIAWRTSEQRITEGKPLIAALKTNWQTFQANPTSLALEIDASVIADVQTTKKRP